MKKYLKIILLTLVMISVCGEVSAQNRKQRLTREQFSETQAKHIADALALNDRTSDRFIKTYMQQQREIWALGPRLKRGKGNSEKDSEKTIQQRFERSQKLLNIREKYYKEYSKFLTQKQIQRMYEIERQTMRRLQARSAYRQRGNR